MSNDIHKADQIAFHFYTKLFYTLNHARATEESGSSSRVDKWFNLETPDSDLFTKEAREPYRSISLAPPPGPPPLEIQVLLSIPELTNNQVLVYMSPDSSRVRIEPTPRFILLETWTLEMNPQTQRLQGAANANANSDVALPIIYKHGIVLFRSVFSLLRVLPAWKFHKRLKRRIGGVNRNHLAIKLRVRSPGDSETDRHILGFDAPPSPTYRSPLPTATHTFPAVAHLLGTFTLTTTYLTNPTFQLDELESLLSSKFISLDLEGFIPTLDKNRQRDSISSSSLPNSSGIRSVMSRSPPKPIGRVTSMGGGQGGTGADSLSIAEKFIIPSRVPSVGPPSLGTTASTGTSALIPPPRPFPTMTTTTSPTTQPITQPIPASGLALNRLRKESLNSSSSSISTRDLQQPPSLSSSPVSAGLGPGPGPGVGPGPLPIRRQNINPFKTHTLSSASGSSPSLSIRQGAPGAGAGGGGILGTSGSPTTTGMGVPSSLSGTGGPGGTGHSRQPSSASPGPGSGATRFPPSPMSATSPHPSPPMFSPSPSSLGDRRPGTSGSNASSTADRDPYRDRRISTQSLGGHVHGLGLGLGSAEAGEDPRTAGGAGPVPMPPRKRYSSSFGHRYAGSTGSATGSATGVAVGSASSGGMNHPSPGLTSGITGTGTGTGGAGASPASGSNTPASLGGGGGGGAVGQEGKKEGVASTSFLGTATDDDEISIFVQDIDKRKPLSGRAKEKEKRDQEREGLLEQQGREQSMWQPYDDAARPHSSGQGHDRDDKESTVKGKERERSGTYDTATQALGRRERERRPLGEVFGDDTTSPPALGPEFPFPRQSQSRPPLEMGLRPSLAATTPSNTGAGAAAQHEAGDAEAATSDAEHAAQLSTSPSRGPMLTSQNEVEERLRKMNETFLKSLEGISGGSTRRKDKDKDRERRSLGSNLREEGGSTSSPSSDDQQKERERERAGSAGTSADHSRASSTSRGRGLGLGLVNTGYPLPVPVPRAEGSTDRDRDVYPSYPYNPGHALGLGRGRHYQASTSSSTLATSEMGTASQGSEEVIGRMELYEERRRSSTSFKDRERERDRDVYGHM